MSELFQGAAASFVAYPGAVTDATVSRQAHRALKRASRGQSLDRTELVALLAAAGDDRRRLIALAGDLRDDGLDSAGRPGVITYSPKVFIPLTRLCRDRCHYCTFATTPARLRAGGADMFMSPQEVLAIARAGAAAGCGEALFTLGDRPELRWRHAERWLDERGYESTLAYLRAMAIMVLEETGLLPHLNPGVMSWQELARLRPVAASMGLMLESSATRLFTEPGGPHFGSPDKDPGVRLRTIEDAGRQSIPFTTGLLVGIGETGEEFVDSLLDLRRLAREYGHIQEVIIQNFRAKPGTALAGRDSLGHREYLNALAVARIVFGPRMRIQSPPNLSRPTDLSGLLAAGVDDWGGISPVTADHVNPECAWPERESLRQRSRSSGLDLRARLAIQPEFVRRQQRWVAAPVEAHIKALADDDGMMRADAIPQGLPWQEAPSYAAVSGHAAPDHAAAGVPLPRPGVEPEIDLRRQVGIADGFDDASMGSPAPTSRPHVPAPSSRLPADVRAALDIASNAPQLLARPEHENAALALMQASGEALTLLATIADDIRADVVGEAVTYVVNRNINFTNICYTGCRFCAFAQRESDPDAYTRSPEDIGSRVDEAVAAGATEICMQGGIHPKLPGTAYFELAALVKSHAPGIHLHAFSPMEVHNGASRSGLSVTEWLIAVREAGVDSLPGTAAEILDDEIRWVLTKGKLPARAWVDIVVAAHQIGLPTTSTMMYGHVDAPIHWVRHLRLLREIQERTGGFTEFVGLPYVHYNAPLHLAGVSRPGPTARDDLAVTAMARIMLAGAVDNIQVSWVKLGAQRSAQLLQAGANDVGGTLMEESISRMAGAEHGSALTVAQLRQIAARCGRPARQRTTLYRSVDPPVEPANRSQVDLASDEQTRRLPSRPGA